MRNLRIPQVFTLIRFCTYRKMQENKKKKKLSNELSIT